jgi:hypothetical protein
MGEGLDRAAVAEFIGRVAKRQGERRTITHGLPVALPGVGTVGFRTVSSEQRPIRVRRCATQRPVRTVSSCSACCRCRHRRRWRQKACSAGWTWQAGHGRPRPAVTWRCPRPGHRGLVPRARFRESDDTSTTELIRRASVLVQILSLDIITGAAPTPWVST